MNLGREEVRIMSKFWNFIKNAATEISEESIELRIEGDIVSSDDSWIYEWFGIPVASPNTFRNELSQYKGKDITVWIDSYGGDVFAGAGIYNALKEHDGKVTVKVDGKAMSAASVIAMAGDEILMSPVSIMMIHNPLSYASGYASDLRKQADVLDTVKETILNAYAAKVKMPRHKISEMMDNETYMDANTAVKEGFADGILYQDSNEPSKVVNFAFNKLSIQNCANEAFKQFIKIEAQQLCLSKPLKNEKEETILEIKNVEDLKKEYPELVQQVENAAKDSGRVEERDRLKAIDEIGNNLDPELVNKAKYIEPMNAEKLAFEAIKNDVARGQNFINARITEIQNSKVNDVAANNETTPSNAEDEKKIAESIANAINKKRGTK
jgi:ATP-dependent protease ClpP protease subunit